jgi:hypoxanthine phosphoribosyltransferase
MDKRHLKRILITEEELKKRVAELGKQITADYADKELVLVGVMKGIMFFITDLARAIDLPIMMDFISLGFFANSTRRTGVVRINKDLEYDISGKHVLIIEDIIRSGLTTGYLMQNLETRGAASLKICTMLQSPSEQLINIPIAYVGFDVPKARLMGYGLDYEEKYRNLPYIAEVKDGAGGSS